MIGPRTPAEHLGSWVPLDFIGALLGHASVSTTKLIYAHSTVRQLRQGFDRFSVRPEDIA